MAKLRLRMIAGPNGSGKSKILDFLEPWWLGVYINADRIQRELDTSSHVDLTPFGLSPQYEEVSSFFDGSGFLEGRPGVRLALENNQISFGRSDSYLAATTADFVRHSILHQKRRMTFETVMSHPSKIDFLCRARGMGYRTYVYFIATESPEINISRVKVRVASGGHSVPEEKIVERYYRSMELLESALQCADRAYIFDNSGSTDEQKLLFELRDGEGKVHAETLPAWFQKYVLDKMA